MAQLQQQYITLQIQAKQLISQQSLHAAQTSSADAASSEKLYKEELEHSAKHYQNLCEEIKELRKQLMSKDFSANQVTSRKPSAHLIQVLKDVVASSAPTTERGKGDLKPSADSDNASPRSLFPPPPTKAMKSKENDELRTQLIAAESRAADLASKQISLQEELSSYQTHMREIIPQYQKQIQQLQAQVQTLKKKTSSKKSEGHHKETLKIENSSPDKSNPPVEELKLPPIV